MSEADPGAGSTNDPGPGGADPGKKDKVLYETHQKLLTQLKKGQEKLKTQEDQLAVFEADKKAFEEKQLNDDGEVRKILELRDKEITDLKTEITTVTGDKEGLQRSIADSVKLNAFYEKLPGKIKRQEYFNFVDLKQIVVDPESGEPDSGSVDLAVNSFMESYSDLVDAKGFKPPPGDAPYGSTKLTKDEWLKMPLAEKKKNVHRLVKTANK